MSLWGWGLHKESTFLPRLETISLDFSSATAFNLSGSALYGWFNLCQTTVQWVQASVCIPSRFHRWILWWNIIQLHMHAEVWSNFLKTSEQKICKTYREATHVRNLTMTHSKIIKVTFKDDSKNIICRCYTLFDHFSITSQSLSHNMGSRNAIYSSQ